MAYDFEKLSEVSSLDEFPDGAKVLIEHDGDIKRCAANGLGGGGYHWIHLDMDVETGEITCDEEITIESLREDIVNGIMPAVIMDIVTESEGGSASTFLVIPFTYINVTVEDIGGEQHETRVAIFASYAFTVTLIYAEGQYIWEPHG